MWQHCLWTTYGKTKIIATVTRFTTGDSHTVRRHDHLRNSSPWKQNKRSIQSYPLPWRRGWKGLWFKLNSNFSKAVPLSLYSAIYNNALIHTSQSLVFGVTPIRKLWLSVSSFCFSNQSINQSAVRGPHAASQCVLCSPWTYFIILRHLTWWEIAYLILQNMLSECRQLLEIFIAVTSCSD
jgi:hypothetical protein